MTTAANLESRTEYERICLSNGNGPAVRGLLDLVGDKWSLLTIGTLRHGGLRFGELKRHIPGISQRMLTLTLRQLERDGLVERTVYPGSVMRVDYTLTPTGQTLIAPSLALAAWALEHYTEIVDARQRYDDAARTPAVEAK